MTSQKSLLPEALVHLSESGHWALFIQPKIPEISVSTSNGMDNFGLVRLEYSGPALKVVHSDRSGHFGRSDRNVPFHLTKVLFPVPLYCILLTRTTTRHTVACVESVQPVCTVPLGTWNFSKFQTRIFVEWKAPIVSMCTAAEIYKGLIEPYFDYCIAV